MKRNKSRLFIGITLSAALALGACGEEENVTEHVGDDLPTPAHTPDEADPAGGVDDPGGETFGFTEIEVEATYPTGEEFYVNYEEIKDQVDAEYVNGFEGVDEAGNDAWDEMEQAISTLEIDPEMPEAEVIEAVITAFELTEGFETLQVEVTYADGTDSDYEYTE